MKKVGVRVGGCYAIGRTQELLGTIFKIIKETDTDYITSINYRGTLTIPKTIFRSLIESNGVVEINEKEAIRISTAYAVGYH